MNKRIPMKGGDEYDAWKAGQIKKIKRAYNKRFRKYSKGINYEE
jgi:capsid portal protein